MWQVIHGLVSYDWTTPTKHNKKIKKKMELWSMNQFLKMLGTLNLKKEIVNPHLNHNIPLFMII